MVVLTGGGTGGHLAIVRAVAEALAAMGHTPGYIGSQSGQDRQWFDNSPLFDKTLFLPTRGVVNRRGLGRASALWEMAKAVRQADRQMKAWQTRAVLGVGGFSAAPATLAAALGRAPLFIHEQNAVPGTLNRLLKPFAKAFFSAYTGDRVPYPVSLRYFQTARTRRRLERVIFLGGSQGARAINDLALALAPRLLKEGIAVSHQTGRADYERVKEAYESAGIVVEIFAFDANLHEKIARADFAVSRAGASTLWELTANRLPTFFVPYPYAAGDHQYHNARYLAERGAAWVAREHEIDKAMLLEAMASNLQKVSEKMAGLIAPGGAEEIAKRLVET
ncbi:MAG: UDP-N-acetylglucosamine--N-acetylmuramyl-(pentapeptide) pyrophosphoryl-undecaprenol N-acetylglucosamine transferase [Epsilonproteobacteria bacterium]|nr:UDP-N-acetylglucosamine--N-acetylmuramyl-(pentapeptide) pyrophosphoryl-undecaprenol N-acetylglucosamine transferase [Campylobacterota bacterium]